MAETQVSLPPPAADLPKNIPFGTAWDARQGQPPEDWPRHVAEQPKTLTEVNKQILQEGSELIDDIIASRDTQGNYFAVYGGRTEGEDQRVIILRNPHRQASDGQPHRFLVITEDGFKEIIPKAEDTKTSITEALADKADNSVSDKSQVEYNGKTIKIAIVNSSGPSKVFEFDKNSDSTRLRDIEPEDMPGFKRVFDENIKATEAPVKRAAAKLEAVKGFRSSIQALPQRS